MNTREKFRYMAFGGALVFLGMVGAMMSPLTAERDKFGEIECTRLTVVDADGKMRVLLTTMNMGVVSLPMARTGNQGRRSVSMNMAGMSLPLARTGNQGCRSVHEDGG